MNINLDELEQEQVIDRETAARIRAWQLAREDRQPDRLITLFGILGALLTGTGLILLLAHFWNGFSRLTQTFFAVLPLLLTTALCSVVLWRKQLSRPWIESSAALFALASASGIGLLTDIYNWSCHPTVFFLYWLISLLPVLYLMRSEWLTIAYVPAVIAFVWTASVSDIGSLSPAWSILLILAASLRLRTFFQQPPAPFYAALVHLCLILWALSFPFRFAVVWTTLFFTVFSGLFGSLLMIGLSFHQTTTASYRLIARIGLVGMGFILTFENAQQLLQAKDMPTGMAFWFHYMLPLILSYLPIGVLLGYRRAAAQRLFDYPACLFSPLILLFFLFPVNPRFSVVFFNLLFLLVGVYEIVQASRLRKLSRLNLGLLMVSALFVARFMDWDLSFWFRGVVFICCGVAFLVANLYLLRKNTATGGEEKNI